MQNVKPSNYTITEKLIFSYKKGKNTSYFMHAKKTELFIAQIDK